MSAGNGVDGVNDARRHERFAHPTDPYSFQPGRVAWNATRSETLLLVEDEDALRGAVAELLTGAGYRVLQARCGKEAAEVADRSPNSIDVLVTDVVLPDMRGPEVAAHFTKSRPGTPIIYTTGHSAFRPCVSSGMPSRSPCLEKPFTIQQLGQLVRQVLDRHPGPDAA